MKKIRLITGIVLLIAVAFILHGCPNPPVQEVFSKKWKTMSKEDKAKLEKYFKSEEYEDSSEYWDLCFEEGGDTTGRINPWDIINLPKGDVINLYIDNSSSMKGYFESKNLSPLITVLSGIQQYFSGSNINGYYIEKESIKEYPFDQLTTDLSSKKLSGYSDAIQLDGLIKKIAIQYKNESHNSNVIDFIITDGIPSGSNDEVNPKKENGEVIIKDPNNRTFNIDYASTLQSRIANALSGIKDIAASVYQFQSGFNGDYWFFNNTKEYKNWDLRPFYVLVIGNKDMVMKFAESENKGLEFFNTNNKVHFGSVDEKAIKLSGPFKKGTIVDPDEFKEAEEEDGYKGYIVIRPQLSLAGLPYFARNSSYIQKNAKITLDGKDVPFVDKDAMEEGYRIEGGMLTFQFKVEQLKKYRLKIGIKNTTPSWVDESTCLNDKSVSDLILKSRTFNLKYLVEGLKNGITGSKGDVILYEKEFIIDTNALDSDSDDDDDD